ncbi:LamG-like jellyroll fold domain-containing protein [Alloactinosynnema sp. L-07]|uniref:LamG-like jellyroll fold domain-containing protein n=1 Tax=Alloactinosynnema sp. L-07 TaxID=1653480 RepID=UPI0012FA5202|nr:LamG-like jellyroll fold domain-containing protein [Alloactinosynnema sp. L-07]
MKRRGLLSRALGTATQIHVRTLVTGVSVLTLTAGLVAVGAATSASAQPATGGPVVTETDALRAAKETGKPVEIPSQTTETQQVLANPTGTFTLKSHAKPVRVKKSGAWHAVDTTLRANPDGSLTPTASAQAVSFSGGGNQPLITVRNGDKAVAFSWSTPLPKPVVTGNTATYPEVFPGADLQVAANADSYSQVLIVKDAAAASNPALRSVTLRATGTGVKVTTLADGRLSATDAAGAEVFRGPRAVMWDSRVDAQVGPTPTATERGSGRVSSLAVSADAVSDGGTTTITDLTLRVDQARLTGADVVYPVYLDPSLSVRKQHWTNVTDNGWHYYDDPNQHAQVGYCSGWIGCGSPAWRARSYFNLDSSPLLPRNGKTATVWRANFFVHQIWSADHNCQGGQPTVIWESGLIDANTRWPGPASVGVDTRYSNAGGPCPSSDVMFDVKYTAQRAANFGWGTVGFGLLAQNENDRMQWKKFLNDPLFEVDFSFPPNPATDLAVSNEIKCDGKVVTPDAKPTLSAIATDNNNPPLNPALWFHVWAADDSRQASGGGGVRIASGTRGSWPEPDDLGNDNWKFRVYVDNNPGSTQNLNAGYSPWYHFTTLSKPIRQAPTVNSFDYPNNYWGAPTDVPGAITFNANGGEHIAGFTYSFTGSGSQVVPSATDCFYNRTFGSTGAQGWVSNNNGNGVLPLPQGLAPGRHTLYVRSFDAAHKLSPETAYTIYVGPSSGGAYQRIEAESTALSAPSGQSVQPGTYACCDFSGGSQAVLWGTAVGQSFTMRTNVAATTDYEVAFQMTKSSHYGRVAFKIDGQSVGTEFDAYSSQVLPTAAHNLGRVRLTAGAHDFTITVTGTNPASQGYRYITGVDVIILRGLTEYEAEDSTQVALSQPAGQSVPVSTQANCCSAFTVEAEATTRSVPSGQSLQPTTYACCAFSGGSQVVLWNDTQGREFSMSTSVPTTGDYEILMQMTQSPHYGKVGFSVDGQPVGAEFDSYYAYGTTTPHSLGIVRLTAGTHTITAKSTGTNPATQGARYIIGVDHITFRPMPAWSNTGQINFPATSAGKSLSMTFTVPIEADHALGVALTTGPQQGEVRFDLNRAGDEKAPLNNTDTTPVNTNAGVLGTKFVPLGGAHLSAGTYTLTATTVDTNADNKFQIGVDFFTVTRLNNMTTTDFTAAMNNDGIGSDNTVAANIDLTTQSAISAQTLAAAGFAPQSKVRVNGAEYTMPAPRADGTDNVIALGQTIPLSAAQQVKASALGLLVASTCGATPVTRGSVGYTDGTVDRLDVPAVPDWITGSAAGAAVTLPYRNSGVNPELTSPTVKLFSVFMATNPTKTIKNVTLPNYGSSLLPGVCKPALHVLAIAPRTADTGWVGTWAAPADVAIAPPGGTGFANQTLRTVVRPSVTGTKVRIRVANPDTSTAVTIGAASIAAQTGTGAATLATPTQVRFGGSTQVTLPAGSEMLSDELTYPATISGSGNLMVSLHIPTAVALAPTHYSPGTQTWSAAGNQTTSTSDSGFTTALNGSRYLVGVDTNSSESVDGTVVVLGDQLSANAPGFEQNWVDLLPGRVDPPLPGGLVNGTLAGASESGRWRLNETSGGTAADTAGGANASITGGSVAWSTERGGSATFTTGVLATSGPVIDTRRGYTLSAWVKLTTTNSYRTVISQSGTNTPGIALQYRQDTGKWTYVATHTDQANPTITKIDGTAAALNTWTHLTATYDAETKTIALYVDGSHFGTASYTSAWAASGPLAIGGTKLTGGTLANQFNGMISDVRVFPRAATADEVKVFHKGGPITGAEPGLGALSAANSSKTIQQTVLANPAVRTVMISLGANDILAGQSHFQVRQDIAALADEIRKYKRTDGSELKVLLTTIAPLGLASNDPREAVRLAVNADINTDFGGFNAHGKVDITNAVSDPNNQGAVRPNYLTNNQPNASYHSAIADAVATAASTWPPEIEF